MDQAIVIRPRFAPGRRIIAVSDVHGNLDFFRGLMDRVGLTPSDILVLVGDLLEKGPDSLALLRYVMELSRTHTVYPLCGNCDGLVLRFFETDELDERRAPSASWRMSWGFRTGGIFLPCGPLCGRRIRSSAPGCGRCLLFWRRSTSSSFTAASPPGRAWRR